MSWSGGFGGGEPQEELALPGGGGQVGGGHTFEGLDLQGGPGGGMDELPDGDDLAVDQEGRLDHGAHADASAVVVGHDAGAVGVGEQDVVEVGEEARRGRGVGVGAGGVGEVVEDPAVVVAEAAQVGGELFDRAAEAGEAAPGLDVGDRGRAERGQVALDQVPGRGRGGQGPAEPGLGEHEQGRAAVAMCWVPRSSDPRTTLRSSRARVRAARSNPARRAQSVR